jgi:hypothetical protein
LELFWGGNLLAGAPISEISTSDNTIFLNFKKTMSNRRPPPTAGSGSKNFLDMIKNPDRYSLNDRGINSQTPISTPRHPSVSNTPQQQPESRYFQECPLSDQYPVQNLQNQQFAQGGQTHQMPTKRVSKNIDGTLRSPYNQNSEYCPLGTALPMNKPAGRNLASYVESTYLESETKQVSSAGYGAS